MARTRIIPVALVTALAMAAAIPAVAQDAPPPPPHAKQAELRVDFGAGRKIAIQCGDTALQACIDAATPLIDKVAATPAVEGGKPGWHSKGWKGKGKGHGDHAPRGDKPEGAAPDAAPGAEPPPPAPEGGAAPAP